MNKKVVAVVCGGNSSEYIVSLKSGGNIFNSIDTNKFTPYLIRMRNNEWVVIENDSILSEVDKSDFSFMLKNEKIKPAFAFIMIHGTPGEDGVLQGYLDMLEVPYSACGVYASALTFHKFYCNNFLRSFGFELARSLYFQKGDKVNPEAVASELGLPLFIKPSGAGSSFGVSKVKTTEQIMPAIEAAYAESGNCLCEEYIEGMELAVGVCELNGQTQAFLPTEVIPQGEFFDFDSKYKVGGATEITPARLPEEKIKECQKLTSQIYKLIGCKGIVRVDFILRDNKFYFLEINTVPGMTETSFIPQQLNAMGLELKNIVSQVIEQELEK